MTKAALSSQLFKDPESWSGRGLNPRPPARQTGVLPTELTRRRWRQIGYCEQSKVWATPRLVYRYKEIRSKQQITTAYLLQKENAIKLLVSRQTPGVAKGLDNARASEPYFKALDTIGGGGGG